MDWKGRAQRLKRDVPAVLLALRDPAAPWYARALAGLAVAYALSPVDLIPDFIPVLGVLDDLLLLPALVALCIRAIPREVLERCRAEAEKLPPLKKRWYCAVPFLLFWLIILGIVLRAVFS